MNLESHGKKLLIDVKQSLFMVTESLKLIKRIHLKPKKHALKQVETPKRSRELNAIRHLELGLKSDTVCLQELPQHKSY